MLRIAEEASVLLLTADEDPLELMATVIDRGEEMVIDIADQPESDPYLIRGKKVSRFFAGKNEVTDAESIDVVARWALLGRYLCGLVARRRC